MHASAIVTKPRRRARRARRARSTDATTAHSPVATAPPRPPTGWHGQWNALDDRLHGPEDPTGRRRSRVKPVHAVVLVLLAAFAVACFAIVSRSGDQLDKLDQLDQLDGAAVTHRSVELQMDLSTGQ